MIAGITLRITFSESIEFESSAMTPKFQPGNEVRLINRRDQIGTITSDPRFEGGEYWYRVRFAQDASMFPEKALEAFIGMNDPISLLREGVFSTKESFSKLMTFHKLKTPLTNTIYAYQAAKIELLPYQYKPLLKFLVSDNQRLLIADEVGLGKTIEAGLILSELCQRTTLRRVLIVCKANLTHKWRMEMQDKFQKEFRIMKVPEVREVIAEAVEHDSFREFRGICSLESMRSRHFVEELKEAGMDFDLIIVDEAHHLRNPKTNSNKLARVLNELSENMVLLTATPMQLGNKDWFHLLQILDPKEFSSPIAFDRRVRENEPIIQTERMVRTRSRANLEKAQELLLQYKNNRRNLRPTETILLDRVISRLGEIDGCEASTIVALQRDLSRLNSFAHIYTRTRKREVTERAPERKARTIKFEWSAAEADVYRLVTDYVIRRQRGSSWGAFATFATMMPQRQVASCIQAMLEYYQDRLNFTDAQIELDTDDLDEEEIGEEDATKIMRLAQEKFYNEMRNLLTQPIADTKFDKLLHEILHGLDKEQPREKIIIFSYFKKTLEYLSRRLQKEGYSNTVISGDYNDDVRRRRIARFSQSDGPRILLSSEVGSEGLDLQFCHIVVNYDLPWNPMKVEQRIGRLDRYGQRSECILIFNFSIDGTIEQKILDRLYTRIGIFKASIGDLEPILGEQMKSLQHELLRSHLTPEEIDAKIEEEALIIERKRQDLLELEKEGAKFIGQGEYFDEEIKRIKERRRYISPEELATFVNEFFKAYLSRRAIKPVAQSNHYELISSQQLDEFLDKFVIAQYRDHSFHSFLSRLRRGAVPLTFDATLAYRLPELEFVNWFHPLIRAILKYYEEHEQEMIPVSQLAIHSELALTGDYLYVVYFWEIKGANITRRTEAVFMPLHGGEPIDEATSEKLLATLISDSETLEGQPKLNKEIVEKCLAGIKEHFLFRFASHKAELQETNNAVLDIRSKSLEDTWHNRKRLLEQRLQEARIKGSSTSVVSGKETRLRNLQREFEKKINEIEERRKVSESFKEIAAGFLRIT